MAHAGTLAPCPPTPTPPSTARGASSTTSTSASPTSRPAGASTPQPSRRGAGPLNEGPGYFQFDELFVSTDGPPTQHLHLAFQAPDRATVDALARRGAWPPAAATTARRASASTTRATTRRSLLDPDGNNVEAVNHGPATRSVEAVETGRRRRARAKPGRRADRTCHTPALWSRPSGSEQACGRRHGRWSSAAGSPAPASSTTSRASAGGTSCSSSSSSSRTARPGTRPGSSGSCARPSR